MQDSIFERLNKLSGDLRVHILRDISIRFVLSRIIAFFFSPKMRITLTSWKDDLMWISIRKDGG